MSRDYIAVTRGLERYLRERAGEAVLRAHGDGSADSHVAFHARSGFASSAMVRDVLGEALERDRAPASEVAAWAGHALYASRERATASVRDTLVRHAGRRVATDPEGRDFRGLVAALRAKPERAAELLRVLETEAQRALPSIRDARAEAQEVGAPFHGLAEKRPDALDPEDVAKRATSFLASTNDLFAESLDYLEHRLRMPITEGTLLAAIGAADLDDAFRADTFGARMMGLAAPMGLEEPLARRIRLLPAQPGAGPRSMIVAVDPPFDVRIVPTGMRGILGDVSRVEAVGRAVAIALTSPSFSYAHRLPLEGTVSRMVGGLFVRLAFDRRRIERDRRVPSAVQEASRRIAAVIALFTLRLAAVGATHASVRGEEASACLFTATRFRANEALSELALGSASHGPRFVSGLAALSLFERLRERYDEDFDRNPRTQDALRGACERGGSVSAEVVLAELGGHTEASRALADWFHAR